MLAALQVNMLTSSKGTVLRCDVNGKIVMKVFLSGMPDVKLGLNDKLEVCSRLLQHALQGADVPACSVLLEGMQSLGEAVRTDTSCCMISTPSHSI